MPVTDGSDRGNTLDAVARGAGGGTGIAFVEVYDLDRGERSGPCSRATPSGTLPLAIPIFLAQGLTDNVVLPQVTLAYRRSDAGRAAPCSFTLCRVSDIPSPPQERVRRGQLDGRPLCQETGTG